jgi:hypothetical protein
MEGKIRQQGGDRTFLVVVFLVGNCESLGGVLFSLLYYTSVWVIVLCYNDVEYIFFIFHGIVQSGGSDTH